jgi:hypothetical protein
VKAKAWAESKAVIIKLNCIVNKLFVFKKEKSGRVNDEYHIYHPSSSSSSSDARSLPVTSSRSQKHQVLVLVLPHGNREAVKQT